jgi:hypothetical protein
MSRKVAEHFEAGSIPYLGTGVYVSFSVMCGDTSGRQILSLTNPSKFLQRHCFRN